jgi:hypothetical protein
VEVVPVTTNKGHLDQKKRQQVNLNQRASNRPGDTRRNPHDVQVEGTRKDKPSAVSKS